MKQGERNRSADTVFALVLLTLFAVLALFLVLIGGNAYRSTVSRMDKNNELRTSVSYVANKVRAAGKDASLRKVDGVDALVLRERGGDTVYCTYIYYYDGALCEYYAAADDPFSPEDGEELIESAGVAFEERDGVLTISAVPQDGDAVELSLRLRQYPG